MKKKSQSSALFAALVIAALIGRTALNSAGRSAYDSFAPSAPSSYAETEDGASYSAEATVSADSRANTDVSASSVDPTDYANTEITFSAADGSAIVIPRYDGSSAAYTVSETPFFSAEDLGSTDVYFAVSDLDDLGRAGVANAVLGPESMQTHERGSISDIHPSGWWEAKESAINVNRSHLIGNNLAGDQTDCSEDMRPVRAN